MPRTAIALLCALACGALLAACGQSAEEKAKNNVCDAKADIAKQVDTLRGVTPAPGAGDQVQTSLKAIESDLKKIGDNIGDLTGEFKAQVQDANRAFASSVQSTASALGQNFDVSGAERRLSAALAQLASSYQQAWAGVSC